MKFKDVLLHQVYHVICEFLVDLLYLSIIELIVNYQDRVHNFEITWSYLINSALINHVVGPLSLNHFDGFLNNIYAHTAGLLAIYLIVGLLKKISIHVSLWIYKFWWVVIAEQVVRVDLAVLLLSKFVIDSLIIEIKKVLGDVA